MWYASAATVLGMSLGEGFIIEITCPFLSNPNPSEESLTSPAGSLGLTRPNLVYDPPTSLNSTGMHMPPEIRRIPCPMDVSLLKSAARIGGSHPCFIPEQRKATSSLEGMVDGGVGGRRGNGCFEKV